MSLGEAGARLITEFEGFSSVLYDDTVGHATIGYGHLVHLGRYHRTPNTCPGGKCDRWYAGLTPQQGRDLFRADVQGYADAVERTIRVPINQNQFDALTSLCFNIGQGGFAISQVARAVNTGGNVCAALRYYIYGVGNPNPLPGLIRRREAECKLYNTPWAGAPAGSDDMIRINGFAQFFENKQFAPGQSDMQVQADFPHLPAHARGVRLEIFLEPGAGNLVVMDEDGRYAGQVQAARHGIVDAFFGPNRRLTLRVEGNRLTVKRIGIVGYFN